MAKKNKVHYDLIDVHYAKLEIQEDGTPVFSAPKKLPGSVSLETSAEGEQIVQRADGIDYYIDTSNNGYTGTLSILDVPSDFKVDCLGEYVDEVTGILVENADASQNPFALLFGFKGDAFNRRYVFYNCSASRPGVSGENKENQREPDMDEMEFKASPLYNGVVKGVANEKTPVETYNAWYDQVILPGQAPTPNAELSSLSIGSLELSPKFSPGVITYTTNTKNASDIISVEPVRASTKIEITNGGSPVKNGDSATWKSGANTVTVKTTNSTQNKTYTVTVTKS